jgi:hypothetical protein
MRPENVPELAKYPSIRTFVLSHLSMQFGDVRAMLRLPTGDGDTRIENGCNFAAAATICNLISGISVVFFDRRRRPQGPRIPPRDRGARFRNLLNANYYPWQPSEDCAVKTDALYDLARNPLAHALGVLEPGQVPVSCEKTQDGLTQPQVNALDVAYDSGTLPPALEMDAGVWHLNVPCFYAAVVEMFRALICDSQQMQRTEACFARGELTD